MWQWKIKKIKLIDLFKKEVKKKKKDQDNQQGVCHPHTQGFMLLLGHAFYVRICILQMRNLRFRGFTQLYTEFYLVLSDFQIHVLPTLLNGLYKKVN